MRTYVDQNINRYGVEETIHVNHSFINGIQSQPVVTWGLYGYLRADQRESARVQFARVADKIMEWTKPYETNQRFRFPYGIHYAEDSFNDESSWILHFLTGYYASFSSDQPRAAKILEYIRFYGFLNLSDGRTLRQVYGNQTYTYLPANFQDFAAQYMWPAGDIDNHAFHPSINYAMGAINTNALSRNVLAKKGLSIPQVTRNIDLSYNRNFSYLNFDTLKHKTPPFGYTASNWIRFATYGDRTVNKPAAIVNTPHIIQIYAVGFPINKSIDYIKLFATRDSGGR